MDTESQHGMIVAGHLGGYVPGGDPDTSYPQLWDFLIKEGCDSMLDIGCGDGTGALLHWQNAGKRAQGVDGIPQADENIQLHDYTEGYRDAYGVASIASNDYDLVWCCEFVEHVAERYMPYYLKDFTLAPLVVMTHALPGQPGWHHVNLQPPEYWVGVMAGLGYWHDYGYSRRLREFALREEPRIYRGNNYFARTGMAFRRV